MLDQADYAGPIRQHELFIDHRETGNRSALKDLHHEVGVNHTGHTDHIWPKCEPFLERMPVSGTNYLNLELDVCFCTIH